MRVLLRNKEKHCRRTEKEENGWREEKIFNYSLIEVTLLLILSRATNSQKEGLDNVELKQINILWHIKDCSQVKVINWIDY